MIEKISSGSVDHYIGLHGGTQDYARFMVLQEKLNEVIEALNSEEKINLI